MPPVVHVTTAHPRTDTRIFIKEARTLASRGRHAVILLVADGFGDEIDGGVQIRDLGALAGGRLRRGLIGLIRAIAAIRRLRPSVVHFHDPVMLPLGFVAKLAGYRVIYDVHENVPQLVHSREWVPLIARPPLALALRALEWIGARLFDKIIAATPKIATQFPAHKTTVVRNFPIVSELIVALPVQYDQRPPSIAYVGGISPTRGAFEMVQAFGLLNEAHRARFDLVGTFSAESQLDQARQLPGWSSVRHHGSLNRGEVAEVLGMARAGLVLFHPRPNHVDALPNKLFEYMSVGLPVIASDFPLWREIITGACCGLLVDPLDVEAIADAIRWILDRPDEAARMGANGREAVETRFNWDVEAGELLGVYESLITA